MGSKRFVRAMAAATVPLALAVHSVIAIDDVPPIEATPEPPEQRESIDPGFVVRAGEDIDPGFIVAWEDRSNDTGFIVDVPGTFDPVPIPSPTPATPEAPVITLATPLE